MYCISTYDKATTEKKKSGEDIHLGLGIEYSE